ncbi:hypothetical protein PENTCL1PPCAC_16771, partial [Pristionchus entomophagus]
LAQLLKSKRRISMPTVTETPNPYDTPTNENEKSSINVEELVNEQIEKFESELNGLAIASRSFIREESDRYRSDVMEYLEKKITNFECVTLSFSRKIELELVNFVEVSRGLLKCLREQLVVKLPDYDDDAVEDFNERATKIINDESEDLRSNLRSFFLEAIGENEEDIIKKVEEFDVTVRSNDDKRRHRPTAMYMPTILSTNVDTKKIRLDEEIERRKANFDKLLKAISDNFTDIITAKAKFTKEVIDTNITADLEVFGIAILSHNDELYQFVKNQKRLVNATVEEIMNQLSQLNDQPDSVSIAALALQQKSAQLFERIDKQLTVAISEMDKYRMEERREIFRRANASRPDTGMICVAEVPEDILFDGRIKRVNRPPLIDLEGVEINTDEYERDPRIVCAVRQQVLLKRVDDESDEVELFTVQQYRHTNILKCIGTGMNNKVRYLVFENFAETLASLKSKKPEGLSQDEFTQYLNGLQQAIQYLHENNLFHGDLRPENVYLEWKDDDYWKVKLAHFSMRSAREGRIESGSAEQTPFSAPEAGPISSLLLLQRADIWSLGSLIWFALTGITPDEDKISDLPTMIPESSSIPSICDLLKRCWSLSVEERSSVNFLGQLIRNVITDIAFAFEEDHQWTEEREKWKSAANIN